MTVKMLFHRHPDIDTILEGHLDIVFKNISILIGSKRSV